MSSAKVGNEEVSKSTEVVGVGIASFTKCIIISYKSMRALNKKIIVKAYLEQKESHEVHCEDGRVIQLYIGRKYAENNREANPTVAHVIATECNEVSIGDNLVLNHNLITNKAAWIEEKDGYVLLTINADSTVYAKIDENGTLQPVFGNLIAERIYHKEESKIWSGGDKKDDYRFKVLAVSNNEEDVKVGDTVLCYKFSDYEMVYHFKGQECRAIVIKKTDVLGICE